MYEITSDGHRTRIMYNGTELKNILSLTLNCSPGRVEATIVVCLPTANLLVEDENMKVEYV